MMGEVFRNLIALCAFAIVIVFIYRLGAFSLFPQTATIAVCKGKCKPYWHPVNDEAVCYCPKHPARK